jgi:hypothetical protein
MNRSQAREIGRRVETINRALQGNLASAAKVLGGPRKPAPTFANEGERRAHFARIAAKCDAMNAERAAKDAERQAQERRDAAEIEALFASGEFDDGLLGE